MGPLQKRYEDNYQSPEDGASAEPVQKRCEEAWKANTRREQMKTRTVAGFTMAILFASGIVAATKDRDWKIGTVKDSYVYILTIEDKRFRFVVDSGALPTSRHPSVTVLGQIRFATEKGVFYLIDDNGKEFKMSVVKKEFIDYYTPAYAFSGRKIVTASEARDYSKSRRVSETDGLAELKEDGFTITPDPPAPPAK
jgi:hypothetical protein